MTAKTALYRHFDKDGCLLYVGISLKPFARLVQHIHGSHWVDQIDRVTIEYFDCRAEADAAERKAIKTEAPLHNIVHAVSNDNRCEEEETRKEAKPAFPRLIDVDSHVLPHARFRGPRGMDESDIIASAASEAMTTRRGATYCITEDMASSSLDRLCAGGRLIRADGGIYPAVWEGYIHPLAVRRYLEDSGELDEAA